MLTPFILGVSLQKIQSKKFDESAVLNMVKNFNKECFLKEKFYVPALHKCSRDDQIAYYLECSDGKSMTICCGLGKECSVSLK